MNSSVFFLIWLILFILLLLLNEKKVNYEHFTENNVDNFDEIYCKYHNNTFNQTDFYKKDAERIYKKLGSWTNKILLDVGTGCGKHYKYIFDINKKNNKFQKIIGIDKSKNMLNQAKINCSNGYFINDNVLNDKLFKKEELTHITCFTDTLYHNSLDDMKKILANFNYWLKDKGYLFIHIFDRNKLDPSPREYSQFYKDNDGKKHSLTYFNTYTHDAIWNDIDKDSVIYNETIVTKNKKMKNIKTKLYIPTEQNKILDIIRNKGFKLDEIMSMKDVGNDDINLFIFYKI